MTVSHSNRVGTNVLLLLSKRPAVKFWTRVAPRDLILYLADWFETGQFSPHELPLIASATQRAFQSKSEVSDIYVTRNEAAKGFFMVNFGLIERLPIGSYCFGMWRGDRDLFWYSQFDIPATEGKV